MNPTHPAPEAETSGQTVPVPSGEDPLPRHIAIIMDGNGRWARRKGWSRILGHERGTRSVREVTEACAKMGIEQLTLFAFSTENWKRPKEEVALLMKLLRKTLVSERPTIMENNVRLTTIGRREALPVEVREELDRLMSDSAGNTGMNLCLALNYGGRQEIVDAARACIENGIAPEDLDEATFRAFLYQPDMPEIDLLIRTAGEYRVSNFLLWQISYAEIWVTPTFWPDFRRKDLEEGIAVFRKRERRYGGLG